MVTVLWLKIKNLAFTPNKQQAFLEDFATLIEDGVPAKQAAEILAQAGEGLVVEVASDILINIAEGKFIAQGMHGWFPPHIVEIIRAGEEGGTIAQTMRAAAESLSHKTSALSALVSSISYPLVVIFMGFAVAIFINHSIFNNYREIIPVENWPDVGRDVANFANFIQNWWWLLLILLVGIVAVVARLLRNYVGDGRHYLDNIPVLAIYRQLIAARFMQTLGLLIANGIVLKQALKILQYTANPYLSYHLLTMEYRLGGGKDNIAEVLDTGLLDRGDLMRLRIIARGKGFEHALMRQGKHALNQSTKTIKIAGRLTGSFLLGCGALLAVFLIYGIYMVGSYAGAY